MSSNPDHYGCCAGCGHEGLTELEKYEIEASLPSRKLVD